jgi:hypothetical protein
MHCPQAGHSVRDADGHIGRHEIEISQLMDDEPATNPQPRCGAKLPLPCPSSRETVRAAPLLASHLMLVE